MVDLGMCNSCDSQQMDFGRLWGLHIVNNFTHTWSFTSKQIHSTTTLLKVFDPSQYAGFGRRISFVFLLELSLNRNW